MKKKIEQIEELHSNNETRKYYGAIRYKKIYPIHAVKFVRTQVINLLWICFLILSEFFQSTQ